jgi:hypothetical protein
MTIENDDIKKKKSWKRNLIKIILIIVFTIFLYELYKILLNFGASLLLAFLIMLFLTLVFIGLLVKDKNKSFFSRYKRDRNNSITDTSKDDFLNEYEKYHPQKRRIDYINIRSKYRKPLVRKCSNCGIMIPGFVKKCPNCGERIGT